MNYILYALYSILYCNFIFGNNYSPVIATISNQKMLPMLQTSCEIRGLWYKLKYTRINTKDGELFKGILFLKSAFGFSYMLKKDKVILFDPPFADEARKDAIIKAIAEDTKSNFIKLRFQGK